jgi:O-antigen ligase
MRWREAGSTALLIPGIWLAIQGSRPVSYWFGLGGGDNNTEGNPINTFIFAVLIVAAVIVLGKRGLNWGELIWKNRALFLIYFYFALSAFWSDMPLVSLKRLVKDFGCVLVALVLLTEENPAEAVRTVFVRVAYFLFPLSLVVGKYFPEIGRGYTNDGDPMFTGLTTQKNTLGQVVFVFGLIILWDLIETVMSKGGPERKHQSWIRPGIFLLGVWLLVTCDSQTSLVCFVVGIIVLWSSGRLVQMKHGKRVLISCLAVGICLAAADKTFGFSEIVIRALGRNPTLTGRTDIWRVVKEQKTDPLIGEGFYIFWDSAKGGAVVDSLTRIQSTHNGYLEMYVDGGLLGDILLGCLLLLGGRRVINRLFSGAALGRIGLVFWVIAIIYNLSESSFFRLNALWFTLLLVMIECPRRSFRSAVVAVGEGNGSLASGEVNPPSACGGPGLERSITKLRMPIINTDDWQHSQTETGRGLFYDRCCWLPRRAICTQLSVEPVLNQDQRFDVSSCGSVRFLGGSVRFSGVRIGAVNRRWPFLRRFGWWSSNKVFPSWALA